MKAMKLITAFDPVILLFSLQSLCCRCARDADDAFADPSGYSSTGSNRPSRRADVRDLVVDPNNAIAFISAH